MALLRVTVEQRLKEVREKTCRDLGKAIQAADAANTWWEAGPQG